MKRIFRSKVTVILALVVLVVSSLWVYAYLNEKKIGFIDHSKQSTLKFRADNRAIVQQPYSVAVVMDSGNKNVNAVGIYLRFDPQKLQLLNMDTKASFCQYYPEKKFDNALGTITLACGSPHPGSSGTNTIMNLEFLPLAVGSSNILTDSRSQIIASDGKGTNLLNDYPQLEVPVYTGL